MWGMGAWSGSDDTESLASLHRAVELGCTFFDTAWACGQGHSERLLGQVARAHRDRPIVVASKIPPKNMKWPGRAE
jgi:aryl-alcohol dehydrogenase-like predicted oxidoreductase